MRFIIPEIRIRPFSEPSNSGVALAPLPPLLSTGLIPGKLRTRFRVIMVEFWQARQKQWPNPWHAADAATFYFAKKRQDSCAVSLTLLPHMVAQELIKF
jgi:hypothetical protein